MADINDDEENDFFPAARVRELGPADYYLGSRTPTMLRSSTCSMILFYLRRDRISRELAGIWNELAANIAVPDFYSVNCSQQREILQAYKETGADPDHPLYPFRLEGFPTIIVYRDGWPQAFYNGPKAFDALFEFATTLACRAGYYEPVNDFLGVELPETGADVLETRPADEGYPLTSRDFPGTGTAYRPLSYVEQLEETEPDYNYYSQSPSLVPYVSSEEQ